MPQLQDLITDPMLIAAAVAWVEGRRLIGAIHRGALALDRIERVAIALAVGSPAAAAAAAAPPAAEAIPSPVARVLGLAGAAAGASLPAAAAATGGGHQ